MGHCTWFKDKIFGVVIGDLCYDHDFAYRVGGYKVKLVSDLTLAKGVWNRASRSEEEECMKTTIGNLFWLAARVKGLNNGNNKCN